MKRLALIIMNLMVLLIFSTTALAEAEKDWTVNKVKIDGLDTLSRRKATPILSVKPSPIRPWMDSQIYELSRVEMDVENLKKFLEQEGFFHATIEPDIEKNGKKMTVDVTYNIVEGPPVMVESLHINGIEGLGLELREKILDLAPLKAGDRLRTKPYGNAKDQIVTLLNNSGYPDAVVAGSILVDKEENTTDITLDVTPGDLSVFGPISIKGLENTDPEVILSRLTYEEGDTFSREEMVKTQREIYALGFFANVSMKKLEAMTPTGEEEAGSAEDEVPPSIPVEITGQYRKFKSLRFGVGYGTEDKVRLQAGWRHRHISNQARMLDFLLKYSDIVQSAEARWWRPCFFSRKQELKNTLGVKRQDELSYIDLSYFNDFAISRKFHDYWIGTVGHQLELHRPLEYSADLEGDLSETEINYLLSSLSLGIERDSRPKSLNPKRGTYFSNRVWWGSGAIGSEIDYFKLMLDGSALYPLSDNLVLATKVRFAGIEPQEDTETVPLFMRLFAGGSHSVRGYEYQKMGPRDDYGKYVGGQSLWEGSIELRYPIYKKISGVVFSDAGAVIEEPFSWDGGAFRYTAGPGLRYESPVGALSLDVGFQLNPEDDDDDRYRIHFSVGHAF